MGEGAAGKLVRVCAVCAGAMECERPLDIRFSWYRQPFPSPIPVFIPVFWVLSLTPWSVATHRYNAEEGDWGFTRFYELRKLFNLQWEGRGTTLVQNDEANVTAYVRVVKDPTGVLWHSFQKYASVHNF